MMNDEQIRSKGIARLRKVAPIYIKHGLWYYIEHNKAKVARRDERFVLRYGLNVLGTKPLGGGKRYWEQFRGALSERQLDTLFELSETGKVRDAQELDIETLEFWP